MPPIALLILLLGAPACWANCYVFHGKTDNQKRVSVMVDVDASFVPTVAMPYVLASAAKVRDLQLILDGRLYKSDITTNLDVLRSGAGRDAVTTVSVTGISSANALSWSLALQGTGDLLPERLPATFPPLSAWDTGNLIQVTLPSQTELKYSIEQVQACDARAPAPAEDVCYRFAAAKFASRQAIQLTMRIKNPPVDVNAGLRLSKVTTSLEADGLFQTDSDATLSTSTSGLGLWMGEPAVKTYGWGATLLGIDMVAQGRLPASLPPRTSWSQAFLTIKRSPKDTQTYPIDDISTCAEEPAHCPIQGGTLLQLRRFDAADPNYHCYRFANLICDRSDRRCTPQAVYDALRYFPAPRLKFDAPVKSGNREELVSAVTLTADNLRMDEGPFFGSNFISYLVEPKSMEIANITTAAHDFHNGWVHRKVVTRGSAIYVQTTGSGVGPNRALNLFGGAVIFKALDMRVQDRVLGK